MVVLDGLSDSATSLVVVAVSPACLFGRRILRIELACAKTREVFDQGRAIVVNGSKMGRTGNVCLAPSDDFGSPRFVDVPEAVHLGLHLGDGTEKAGASCSGLVSCII